jgi:hypothetical protein
MDARGRIEKPESLNTSGPLRAALIFYEAPSIFPANTTAH